MFRIPVSPPNYRKQIGNVQEATVTVIFRLTEPVRGLMVSATGLAVTPETPGCRAAGRTWGQPGG